jgi:protocatechuate 3,4-dioxygenase beta subunit
MTDAQGYARFVTIYPGWYKGRAVHLHFKIRSKTPDGGNYEFTSQLFFDDVLSDRIYAKSPYAGRGMRDTRNNNDQHYQRTGDQLQVNLTESSQGYVAIFDIGLDLNDAEAGRSDGFQPPPGGPPPGNPPPGAFGGPPGSPPVTR